MSNLHLNGDLAFYNYISMIVGAAMGILFFVMRDYGVWSIIGLVSTFVFVSLVTSWFQRRWIINNWGEL